MSPSSLFHCQALIRHWPLLLPLLSCQLTTMDEPWAAAAARRFGVPKRMHRSANGWAARAMAKRPDERTLRLPTRPRSGA